VCNIVSVEEGQRHRSGFFFAETIKFHRISDVLMQSIADRQEKEREIVNKNW
jgi:hypothetical protein